MVRCYQYPSVNRCVNSTCNDLSIMKLSESSSSKMNVHVYVYTKQSPHTMAVQINWQ